MRGLCVGKDVVLDTYGSECISMEYNLAIESIGDMESNGTRIGKRTINHPLTLKSNTVLSEV